MRVKSKEKFTTLREYKYQTNYLRDSKGNIIRCKFCTRPVPEGEHEILPQVDGNYIHLCTKCYEKYLDARLKDFKKSDPMNLAKEKSIEKHIKGE